MNDRGRAEKYCTNTCNRKKREREEEKYRKKQTESAQKEKREGIKMEKRKCNLNK